ncbi:acid phosphatase phoa [Grosmannia clavigera kw1407]|uniref:Acid phosphatase phoa n=1 Tax=Grosmannia clavigera (strain kw1407 / UAMH 11150) TaxID=655863 RepID=F0X777_GROCL|nr:acid phosphatase phoa [Grosmannia clavigera kw1407]EFX06642.1 acid phosphatase phoa [Grosmannia clavigera kw1407]
MRSSLAVLVAAAVAVSAQTQNTATSVSAVDAARATAISRSPVSHVKGKAFDRLAIIWLENTDYTLAVNDPNLAFFAKKGITLENYYGVTHPSEPNYAASIAGDYFGMNNDNFNFVDQNITTLMDLLDDRGISWGEYQEDQPYAGFEGFGYVNQKTGANDYVRKHNPAVLYDSVTRFPERAAQIKNLTAFYDDLEDGTLPQWMFITPNMTSDGHDTSVTVAGRWVRNFLEPLLEDRRFMQNTLVLITFDENATYAKKNNILALLLGDAVPKELVGTVDSNYYNHYSEISTAEANWDLPTLGRWDVGANVFQLVADRTGDTIREWNETDFAAHYFNSSYDGVFNSAPKYGVYPKPALCLVHNERPVSPIVKATWRGSTHSSYYKDTIENNDGLNPPAGYDFK